ncbi:insulinase family protein [Natronospirillum operosum]|uniref:Insulinase family protein n=1 Tax=Natronospirillum operosum TaxID=2759953 RepID=A0A4Z0W4Q3_9GAMM|nr:insulinase family protein [Natronospirillum operosum]TGG92497.1 insulinase family protein [Natronospirillum operosum]
MLTKWFLHGLLAVVVLVLLTLGGLWWWSVQPADIRLTEAESRQLTLDNGMEVEVVSDPDAPAASLDWRWLSGTVEDPQDWPARHQLFSRVLFYGESDSGYRHLETRALRDPLGAVSTRVDRTHTHIQYQTSPSAFAEEVDYVARLLRSPTLPLEGIAYERGQLTGLDAAYDFMSPGEVARVSALLQQGLPDLPPLQHDMAGWEGMSNEAVARELARYADDRLTAPLMQITLRAPMPLSELEALARETFGRLRDQAAEPSAESLPEGPVAGLPDARTEPVSVNRELHPQAPDLRLLYPWRLGSEQLDSADRLVNWFNQPYEEGITRQLQNAGIIEGLQARFNDDFLILDIDLASNDAADLNRLHSTLASFLAQLLNHPAAPTRITRIAGEERVAEALTLYDLDLDPTLLLQLDLRGNAAASAGTLPEPDLTQALTLQLPRSEPERSDDLPGVDPNEYELLGWQPGLLLDEEGATVWHYEDNRFGTTLASAHVRVHYPIGPDQREQERWRRWAYRHGPGWSNQIIWTDHHARTPAQGLRVEVDDQGVTWHYTDRWPEVEPWLYDLIQQLEGLAVELPEAMPEVRQPDRLMRERAGLLPVPQPEDLGRLRNTVLLSGRIPREDAGRFAEWLETQRPAEHMAEVPPRPDTLWRLDTGHRVAELSLNGGRSQVSRVLQVPEYNMRQRTLADWTFPWLEETLTMAVRGEEFGGELNMALRAPLGYTGLDIELSSQTQDPARLGLYLETFWVQLALAAEGLSSERFRASTQRRADLLRDAASTLPALAAYHWDDITAGRPHFNGRLQQARTLEGTNMDGWQFFVRQWLFDTNARQLTVYEIGADWADDYSSARQMPAGAREW